MHLMGGPKQHQTERRRLRVHAASSTHRGSRWPLPNGARLLTITISKSLAVEGMAATTSSLSSGRSRAHHHVHTAACKSWLRAQRRQ